ncbi:hypothetical protein LCGC14_3085340 [marine sediment metagenome]|uniref:Uncharacterized protein n=1 Tax=marine sediment metagenome TaxID=412755 RepID=A0A0F8YJR5_9ZZZZ
MKLGIYKKEVEGGFYIMLSKCGFKNKTYFLTDLTNGWTWEYNWTQKKMIAKMEEWGYVYCGKGKMVEVDNE